MSKPRRRKKPAMDAPVIADVLTPPPIATASVPEPEPQQPIQLHFSLATGLSSRLIEWWGSGYGGFSHTDAILSDGKLAGARSDAVGGQPPGFRIRPPYYEDWKRSAILTIPATASEHATWEAWQRAQQGDEYDGSDILGLIIGVPLNEGAGHWICSAAQLTGLQIVKKLPARLPFVAQQTTPSTLLAMGSAIPGATFQIIGPTKAAPSPLLPQ